MAGKGEQKECGWETAAEEVARRVAASGAPALWALWERLL